MHVHDQSSETQAEARRQLDICNACRYCEGYCAVFPALQRRVDLTAPDIGQLANLCHNCKGCYYACQYSPPHPFQLNLPVALSLARAESYVDYAWPQPLARLLRDNGTILALVAASVVAILMLGVSGAHGVGDLFAVRQGAGAFYQAIPWGVMAGLAGATLLFAILALTISGMRFWRHTAMASRRVESGFAPLSQAVGDVLTLRNLGGGGHGCNDSDAAFSTRRRRYHHAMFYGFLLCFASTASAWLMDSLLGWPAPYPAVSVPVLLGVAGGVGLTVGCAGLLVLKLVADQAPTARSLLGADAALLILLLLIAVSGLFLLVLRATPAMTLLLAFHLGLVLALFAMLPYSKMVHGLYRGLALLRDRQERAARA